MSRTHLHRGALVAAFALATASPAFGQDHAEDMAMEQANIVETAVAAGSFNTLAAALEAAGLVETLEGEGPFTVFAPTDDAFAKLPAGTVEELLKPENKEKLTKILTYHVVPGEIYAADALAAGTATTVEGSDITIRSTEYGAKVQDANIVQTDIATSNGVIHVIDSVILPKD